MIRFFRAFWGCMLALCMAVGAFAQDSLPTTTPDTSAQSPDTTLLDSGALVRTDDNLSPARLDTLGLLDLLVVADADGKTLALTATPADSSGRAEYWALVKINSKAEYIRFKNHKANHPYAVDYKGELLIPQLEAKRVKAKQTHTLAVHLRKRTDGSVRQQNIPLGWSVVPPILAIALALIFRQVLLSLFVGILAGAWLVNGMPMTPYELMKSLFYVLDHYILHALTEPSHLSVIIFSLMIGGVVALISRNGGMEGIVSKLSPLATGPKSTQFVSWLLGIAIFFDDYANSLIVGNTMRPLCDKYNVSREKLSYIVDSTSAPVAAIAFITTWIGAELGYISDALPLLDGLENPPGAYSVFLSSLAYSFYSFFTILFMLLIVFTGRDFGAMYHAEHRARTTGKVFAVSNDDEHGGGIDLKGLEPVPNAPRRWLNGFLPIAVVVGGTLLGLLDTGMTSCYNQLIAKGIELKTNGWGEIWNNLAQLEAGGDAGTVRKLGILVGSSDSYSALLWASLSAAVLAIFLTVVQRIQRLEAAMDTLVLGFKTMLPALLILILAWALAATTKDLATANFLTSVLGDSVSPYLLPVIIFFLAGGIAFSTGSSWSTMAILYPIAIPMTWTICQVYGLSTEDSMPILYNVIAVVLSASVFGDHCSPISDTTILSSLASNCNHLDHVKTQLPYAFLVGAVSIGLGYASTAFGIPFLVSMALGVGILVGWLYVFGKQVDA